MRVSFVRNFRSRLGFSRMFYFDVIGCLRSFRFFLFFPARFVIGRRIVFRILHLIRLVLRGCYIRIARRIRLRSLLSLPDFYLESR